MPGKDSSEDVVLATNHHWLGPIPEVDQYGEPTGYCYVCCVECGVEVLEDEQASAAHYASCPLAIAGKHVRGVCRRVG